MMDGAPADTAETAPTQPDMMPTPAVPAAVPAPPPAPVAPPAAPAAAGLPPEVTERIRAMLSQGKQYKDQLQYDKAIATAESVLMLDPGNQDAKRLAREARDGQQAALQSIEIE